MANEDPPTLEGLAAYVAHIMQVNETMQTALTNLEAESLSRITSLKTEFQRLANYTNELERKLTTKTANARDNEMKRIMNTNLLKGQEFTKFTKKDSYELWIDGIKNDLYSQLPDAKKFIEYAVQPPVNHSTTDSAGSRYLPP